MLIQQGRIVRWILAALLLNLFTVLTISQPARAAGTQQAECQIGSSSSCPALTPQEIYNMYGTTTDGNYYINDNGTATQVYLKMNRTNTANGGWVLMMKGKQGSTAYYYSDQNFTSSTYYTASALTTDTSTDGKSNTYNDLPITSAVLSFSNPAIGTLSNNGDIANNGFGGWVWSETFSSQTMYTLLTTNKTITNTYATLRTSLWKDGSSNAIFANESGYAIYGFNHSTACNSLVYRWGIIFNNETYEDGSCDTHVGIGLESAKTPGDQATWNGVNAAYGTTTSNAYNGGLGPMAFQLWGKMADPAFGTPQNLTVTSPSAGQASLSWNAPASGTVNEYVVQYKRSSDADWSAARTFRVTGTSGSATALVTGLSEGTQYNFKVWARSTNDSSATPLTGNLTVANGVLSAVSLNSTSPIYRTTDALTATVSSVGYATFYAQGKAIPGCKNILTSATSVTCNWIPAQIAYINLSVSYAPSALPSAVTTSSLRVLVSPRAVGSHKR